MRHSRAVISPANAPAHVLTPGRQQRVGEVRLVPAGNDTVCIITLRAAVRLEAEQGYFTALRPLLVMRPTETWLVGLELTSADPDVDPNVVALVAGLLSRGPVNLEPIPR